MPVNSENPNSTLLLQDTTITCKQPQEHQVSLARHDGVNEGTSDCPGATGLN